MKLHWFVRIEAHNLPRLLLPALYELQVGGLPICIRHGGYLGFLACRAWHASGCGLRPGTAGARSPGGCGQSGVGECHVEGRRCSHGQAFLLSWSNV